MKKVCYFTVVALVSALLACTIPSSIELHGNPVLRFSASMDFNEFFSEALLGSFEEDGEEDTGVEIVEALNTKYQTFILHKDLFEDEIEDALGDLTLLPDGLNYTNPNDEVLVPAESISEPLNISEFMSKIEGFKFKKVNSMIYISGSDIVEQLRIKMTISNDAGSPHILDKERSSFKFGASDFDKEKWEKYPALPSAPGELIDLTEPINSGNNIDLSYEVILPAGRTFPASFMSDAKVKAEIVIWVSLELEAKNECDHVDGKEIGGADLDLSDFMDGFDDDLFGRNSADSEDGITNYFEALSLIIELSQPVFNGAVLFLESDSNKDGKQIKFSRKMSGKELEIKFDEDTMKKIKNPDYFPFVPDIKIHINRGDGLSIPRNFKSNFIRLEAKLNAKIDL